MMEELIKKYDMTILRISGREDSICCVGGLSTEDKKFIEANRSTFLKILYEKESKKQEYFNSQKELRIQQEERSNQLIKEGKTKLCIALYDSYYTRTAIVHACKEDTNTSNVKQEYKDLACNNERTVMEITTSAAKTLVEKKIESREIYGIYIHNEGNLYEITEEEANQIIEVEKKELVRLKEVELAKVKEVENKSKAVFLKAKETGEKQQLSQRCEPCNNPNEECNTDYVCEWAMPDGSITTTRTHTF